MSATCPACGHDNNLNEGTLLDQFGGDSPSSSGGGSGSYFGDCDRDEGGRCLPKGASSSKAAPKAKKVPPKPPGLLKRAGYNLADFGKTVARGSLTVGGSLIGGHLGQKAYRGTSSGRKSYSPNWDLASAVVGGVAGGELGNIAGRAIFRQPPSGWVTRTNKHGRVQKPRRRGR